MGAAVPALHAAPTYNGVAMSAADVAAAVQTLSGQLRAEINRLPTTSAVEQYEASILFIVDQSGQPEEVICASFDLLNAEAATPANARTAMTNVCRIIKRRRGTGAISNGPGQFGGAGFSSPVISLGGGSANYTPPQ
jgi:hypothetical protein